MGAVEAAFGMASSVGNHGHLAQSDGCQQVVLRLRLINHAEAFMSNEIRLYADTWDAVAKAHLAQMALQQKFIQMISAVTNTLESGEYGELGTLIEEHAADGYFIAAQGTVYVRFSLNFKLEQFGLVALISVHVMPKHAALHKPQPLGQFTLARNGETSFTVGGRPYTINNGETALTVVLHYLTLALTAEPLPL
jgi:hypothetical protein